MIPESFIDQYYELLTGKYKGINLTRITDKSEFLIKQIKDSLLPVDECKVFDAQVRSKKILIDIGFGGGFPILPLAAYYPETQFLGFEARRKKADVVQSISDELGLKNVKLYHQRVENVLFDTSCVITFKAVSTIENCLKNLNIQSEDVMVFFYKGPQLHQVEDLTGVLKKWDLISEKKVDLPGTEGRILLGFKIKNVPRGTFNKKELVKLSELL